MVRPGLRFVWCHARELVIRIALVIPTLDQSGAERQLTLLAASLPREHYQVKVFALNRGGHFAAELARAGIDVEVLGKRFRLDPLTWYRLREGLHRFRPQIVQSFLFAANAYVRLPGVCPAGCRIVVSERCVDSWKSGWQLQLDRLLVGRTAAMTANSQSVADFYAEHGVPRERLTVIPNGVPMLNTAADRAWLRQQLGLRPEDRVVGFVGRLARQKRLEDLTWAFQLLHQVVEHARLVLIGDGPERDEIARLAVKLTCRDKMVFAGHRADAYRLMQGLDAFCLPSEFEGMSNSLLEAMSLGLPVVVSDIPANRELVVHEQNGLTFPLGNAPEMTKALKRVLDDRQLAAQLGTAASRLIAEHYSVEQMVARHEQLYQRLLATEAT